MTNQNGSNTGSDRAEDIKEKVRGFVDGAEARAEAIKARAIEAKDGAMTRGQALIERTTDMIKANPLKAIGIAFGAGYLGMRLFRR